MSTTRKIHRVRGPRRLAVAVAMSGLACAAIAAEPARVLAVCADPSNLPFSNERGEGFENRIASVLAEELHATVNYTWNMQRRSFLRRTLKAGACDVVIGLPTGLQGVAQTRPYYGSSYAFVSPRPGAARRSAASTTRRCGNSGSACRRSAPRVRIPPRRARSLGAGCRIG